MYTVKTLGIRKDNSQDYVVTVEGRREYTVAHPFGKTVPVEQRVVYRRRKTNAGGTYEVATQDNFGKLRAFVSALEIEAVRNAVAAIETARGI